MNLCEISSTLAELNNRPASCSGASGSADLAPGQNKSKVFKLGALLSPTGTPPKSSTRQTMADQQPTPPDTFDWREESKFKTQIEGNLINQSQCGSCWSIALGTTLGDRYMVALMNKGYKILKPLTASATQLLSCDCLISNGQRSSQLICMGGMVPQAVNALAQDIVVGTDKCFPYPQKLLAAHTANSGGEIWDAKDPNVGWNPNKKGTGTLGCLNFNDNSQITGCYDGKVCPESNVKLSVNSTGGIHAYPDQSYNIDLKRDIWINGPVPTSFAVTTGFMNFWGSKDIDGSAKYKEDANWNRTADIMGGHAVSIVGWTKDAWIIRNSWGPTHRGSWYCNVALDNDVGVGAGSGNYPGAGATSYGGAVSFLPDLSNSKVQALVDAGYVEKGDGSDLRLGEWNKNPRPSSSSSSSSSMLTMGIVLAAVVVAISAAIVIRKKKKKRRRR